MWAVRSTTFVALNLKGSGVVPGSGHAGGIDELAYDARRVAGDEGVVGHVLAVDCSGGDGAARSDGHAGQDDRSRADPGPVADANRRVLHRPALDAVAVAVHQVGLVGDPDVIADGDLEDAHQHDAAVDEHPVTDPDPAPAADEGLAVTGPDLEVVADLEVRGVDGGVAEDRGLGPPPLRAAQPPFGTAALPGVCPPPARLEDAFGDGGRNSGQGGHGQRG